MSYWEFSDTKHEEVDEFQNDYRQVIRVGDPVFYPVYGGLFSHGLVKRIEKFKAKEWDYKKQKDVPCIKHHVLIQREVDVWNYDHKVGQGDTTKQMRTFRIYYSGKVVKLKADKGL